MQATGCVTPAVVIKRHCLPAFEEPISPEKAAALAAAFVTLLIWLEAFHATEEKGVHGLAAHRLRNTMKIPVAIIIFLTHCYRGIAQTSLQCIDPSITTHFCDDVTSKLGKCVIPGAGGATDRSCVCKQEIFSDLVM